MSLGKKIKEARLSENLSQSELAVKCGWDSESGRVRINNYEAEKREPKEKDVALIAKATNRQKSWFYSDSFETPQSSHTLPIITFDELSNLEKLDYSNLEYIDLYKPDTFAIKVEGDSMISPYNFSFPAGTTLLVSPVSMAKSGDFVVAELEDNAIVFRKLVLEGNERYLMALNPSWKPININDRIKILGVVVSSLVSFK